jgi:hypothetical protein
MEPILGERISTAGHETSTWVQSIVAQQVWQRGKNNIHELTVLAREESREN